MRFTLAPLYDAVDEQTDDIPPKTLQDLQWAQLLQMVQAQAQTPEAVALIPALRPLPTRPAVERRLAELAEAFEMLADGGAPPLTGFRDTRSSIAHATRGGVLDADELEALRRNCDVASRARRFFDHRAHRFPYLAAVGRRFDPCDPLRTRLEDAIEPGGRLTDWASRELRRLRRSVQNQHDRLRSRVDQLLRRDAIEPHLQDDFYTVREDRYVVPVRISARAHVPGIVHGYSKSGQTAFIEPTELVELNNQLRWAQMELAEEENRILHELSVAVARHATSLEHNEEVAAYVDLVVASARFGRDIGAHIPAISDGEVELKELRHPLLWVKHRRFVDGEEQNDTVPNDLVLSRDQRIFVISGPNTGGKTVLLKSLGLSALMVRCGLPIAAAPGSRLPLFGSIFTDIGDEQSIERDLSTFSGHVTNINTFLGRCGPDSLVLLDELFTGTDPLQGAALATALLEALADLDARCAVTTHLEGLKTLAVEHDRFANASMGFDLDRLQPTYQLTLGVPGSSFALRIARRLGFPSTLVDAALAILEGEAHHSVDEVIASLEDQVEAMRKEQRRLQHERRQAEQARQKFQAKYRRLRDREREMVHKETRELREKLAEARDLVRESIKRVQLDGRVERGRELTQADLNRIQAELRDVDQTVQRASEQTRPPRATPEGLVPVDPDTLEVGQRVFVRSFNREGDIVARLDDQARVQIGALQTTADLDDLFFSSDTRRKRPASGPTARRAPAPSPSHEEPTTTGIPQTKRNTVDLRGLHVDEALEKLEMFLDTAYLESRAGVHIIHGHGTGALKRAVRGWLIGSRYVADFRPGERGEGGDGVTVAALKREA